MYYVTSTEFYDYKTSQPTQYYSKAYIPTQPKLNRNFYERAKASVYMLVGFAIVLSAGQFYSFLLVFFLNLMVFSYINNLKRNEEKYVNIPMTKYINWYIFISVNYYCLGNFITTQMPSLGILYPFIGKILHYHSFISFCGFVAGMLGFVLSLKQGYLKYQFRLFGWIVVAVLLACFQGWSMVHNLYEGMIWFLLPCLLIIINDIFAYIFGYFFGKHQLIALSPKKTWYGYIGGAISTILFSIILTYALQNVYNITCPMRDLMITPFYYPPCVYPVTTALDLAIFTISRLQGHMMIIALFASLIGPFGGFFASGIKRAIKIKDFANVIPGHGGVLDRMDCQFIMGSFVYFYFKAFIKTNFISPASFIVENLSPTEQLSLFHELQNRLLYIRLI